MDISQNFKEDAKAILEAAPDLYLILSPQLTIVGASNAYLKATMVQREEILGCNLFDVFPDNPNDHSASGVNNLSHSLNRVLKELLHSQAIRDPLTGLLNRRFLDEYVVKQIGQAKHSQTMIIFIMIDVDNFKRVNDNFGHNTGDRVLALLSKLLMSLIREGDLACRYGGEEFLLVLPYCNLDNAKQIAETIRNEVIKMPINIKNSVFNITISLGISSYPNHGSTMQELIEAADKALYTAKKQGKNRVIIFSDKSSPRRKS
ncbi:TPA: diguanylate cyclase [Legionella pneumophila]|uniref:GGDEF domain-containing protein n=1 Tax=Legionella pneumophila TaxID=446 RepID=UPI001C177253|nr:diguanylate cyclase [Legionella pneumophila]HBD7429040.1 diguanylate cyclase [Legionella pneumophila]HBD7472763.1 diguanylate cyclase [Legionella pneumophila]HBI2939082.1 diguanylate cyclase [Legionella pneumophila]HBJ7678443.1 diguanylate cyclase [Legionella pneumophila]